MGRAQDLFERLVRDGEAAIDEMIADRAAEELFLDFKRSADNGAGRKLHDDDRKNLARAISGFGNSEGGVLVWGVDAKDVATNKVPIHDPKLFVSRLEGAVSGCTVPPHPLVRHHAIETLSTSTGFAVTLIPKSDLAPHQALKPSLQYYIRAGSDFVPTPHAVLAGMFGRRPQTDIHHVWITLPAERNGPAIEFSVGFQLSSYGPGVVRDMYVSLITGPRYGKYFKRYEFMDTQNWSGHHGYGSLLSLVSKPDYRLAPATIIDPLRILFSLEPPFTEPLTSEISYSMFAVFVRD
jgi:hypothetical protein